MSNTLVETTTTPTSVPDSQRRAILQRRITIIVGLTITWNVIEALIAIGAGHVASSVALIGFGLDSVVEVLSAAAVAWQFSGSDPHMREQRALKIIALSFFGLSIYVTAEAVLSLLGVSHAEESLVGIALATVSLLVMPLLSWWERRTGMELGSRSAVADSQQTLICAYLSAALLIGLILNAWLGWSWADSLVALVIALFALREGIHAWKGEVCCNSIVAEQMNQSHDNTNTGSEPLIDDNCCSDKDHL